VARGGRREGAGRPWGSRDRVKRRSASIAEIATRDALAFMQTNDMQIFEGDSVAFLISVYRNERLPLRERMAAAMAVSPYERVRLTAVDMRIRGANGRSGWNPGGNDKDPEEVRHKALRLIEVRWQEAHEAMIEKAKAGFALIKQDRIYREPDVLLSPLTPAPPPRHEPHVVDVEPTVVEREPEKVPPLFSSFDSCVSPDTERRSSKTVAEVVMHPEPAEQFYVRVKAPAGIGAVQTFSNRHLTVGLDGIVGMSEEDAACLIPAGWIKLADGAATT
jgi:hypothetical protein